jgi:hypothetical protein
MLTSAPKKPRSCWRRTALGLNKLPRYNQKKQTPQTLQHLLNGTRQITETANGYLLEQFRIETNQNLTF